MRLTMNERGALIKGFAEQYRRAGKKRKGRILDQVVEATGCVRRYAARRLRNQGRRLWLRNGVVLEADARVKKRRRSRRRIYGRDVQRELKRLWAMLDYISGRRMAAAFPDLLEALQRHGEPSTEAQVRVKLLRISASTIDRLLADQQRKLRLKKGRSGTRPGTLLRRQVAVRTFSRWDDARPGFVEADLVGHEGGVGRGEIAVAVKRFRQATGAGMKEAKDFIEEAQRRQATAG